MFEILDKCDFCNSCLAFARVFTYNLYKSFNGVPIFDSVIFKLRHNLKLNYQESIFLTYILLLMAQGLCKLYYSYYKSR